MLHKRGICPLSLLHQRWYCLCLSYTRGGYFHCLFVTPVKIIRGLSYIARYSNIAFVSVTPAVEKSPSGRILGRNPDKRKFSSLLFTITSTALPWDFYFFKPTQPLTVSVKEKGVKSDRKPYPLPYGLRNPYRNIKPGNSKHNAQKPQWNCTFMNSAQVCITTEETLFLSEYQHKECEEEFASVWVTPRECCPARVTLEDVLLYLSYLQEEEFASVWVTPRECCSVWVTQEEVSLNLSYKRRNINSAWVTVLQRR